MKELVWVHLIKKIITEEQINLFEECLKLAGSETLWLRVNTATSYRQIKSEQLINTHQHTTPSFTSAHTRPLLTTQWECVFLDHLKPKYLSCMSPLMKFCQEGVQNCWDPQTNNSKIPRIQQGQKHPLLFQIVMPHRKQKMFRQIDSLRHRVWQGIKPLSFRGQRYCNCHTS